LQGLDGVGRLARLTHHEVQGVLIDNGVAVAELAGVLGLRRNAGHGLEEVGAHLGGKQRAPHAHEHHAFDVEQVAAVEVQAA